MKHLPSLSAKGYTVCGKPLKTDYKPYDKMCPRCARSRPKQLTIQEEFDRLPDVRR